MPKWLRAAVAESHPLGVAAFVAVPVVAIALDLLGVAEVAVPVASGFAGSLAGIWFNRTRRSP